MVAPYIFRNEVENNAGIEQKSIFLTKFSKQNSSPCSISNMRKNRELLEGADYHVTARINRGEKIFLAQDDRELFMTVLRRAKRKFVFSLKNFCVMGNHIHLLIKPGTGESLSKIMQ